MKAPIAALEILLATIVVTALTTVGSASTEKVLYNFNPNPQGRRPGSPVADSAGNLYGLAEGGRYECGVLFKFSPNGRGGWIQTVLYEFQCIGSGGSAYGLTIDRAGNLYSVNAYGGTGAGSVIELSPNAKGVWSETTIYNFPNNGNGQQPEPGLTLDESGNIYGTTWAAGGVGVVFELSLSGGTWTESVLYTFSGGSDGGYAGGLVFDQLGNLYGTTQLGGANKYGTVFELSPSSGGTWSFTSLYSFQGGSDGTDPMQYLASDGAGHLFGTTFYGGVSSECPGQSGCGTVFEMTLGSNGQWTHSVILSFGNTSSQGGPVYANKLDLDSHGDLFGSTSNGGAGPCYGGCGTVFELSPSGIGQWTETVLYSFAGGNDGYYPASVVLIGDGVFSTTSGGGVDVDNGTIFDVTNNSGKWQFATLYQFPTTDGFMPATSVVEDGQGNLYGATQWGGDTTIGAVFEMTPNGTGWKEQMIYSFNIGNSDNGYGARPSALTLDSAGNLYGTLAHGGVYYGQVFELSPAAGGGWSESALYSFASKSDGSFPAEQSGVIFDTAGNLYGTTADGGAYGRGTVFELSPVVGGQWTKTTVYSFGANAKGGEAPAGGLIMDAAGNLYGTAQTGGRGTCKGGCGVVFELSFQGGSWKENVLYSFQGGSDGANPAATLIFDAAGNLFGTTVQGGVTGGCYIFSHAPTCGVVFELSPSGTGWTETVLHVFTNKNGDGGSPLGGLVFGADGSLYGTTALGGTSKKGTIFKLTPAGGGWNYSVVHNFGKGYDGAYPYGSLILDPSGNLFGTTSSGGIAANGVNSIYVTGGDGTVFEFTP